jgi:hypothetical protein
MLGRVSNILFIGCSAVFLLGGETAQAQFVQKHGPAYQAALTAMGNSLAPGKRTMDRCIAGSGQIVTDFPNYEGLPVKRCIYTEGGLTGLAYTLHPTKDQLAVWIDRACAKLSGVSQPKCGAELFDVMWKSNNAQYVVTGNVIEDGKGSGCSSGSQRFNIQFRDGVTVGIPTTGGYQMCWAQPRSIEQQEKDRKEINTLAFFVARVSTLDLATLEKLTPTRVSRTNIKHPKRGFHPTGQWLELTRADYLNAIRTDDYGFLELVARKKYGN